MNTTFFKRAAYAALISGMFLTSCSDDVMDDDKKGGTDETQYEQGYVSFSFINATAVGGDTRADGKDEGDLVPGVDGESTLNSGIVVLYAEKNSGDDEKDYEVAYQFELSGSTVGSGNIAGAAPGANGEKKYTTKAQKVDVKAYKLAVFLNAPTGTGYDLKAATAVGKTVADMQKALELTATTANSITGNVDKLIGGSADNFLMSNFAGLVEVAPSYIKSTDVAAEADPVSLFVERAVAKLAVAYKSNINDLNSAFKFSAVTWAPDVLAKQTYWMRKQTLRLDDDNLTDGTTVSGTINEVVGIKPLYRIYMYAESPDFEDASQAAYDNYPSKFNEPSTKVSTRYNNIAASDVTKQIGTIAYVPENTMRKEEQYEDITTSIVIKAVFAPTKTTLGANLGANGNESYFVYKSKVFSLAELESIFDDSFTSGGKDWAAYEAVNTDLAGFQALLQDKDTRKEIEGTETWDYTSEPSKSVKYEGIAFYKGGVNYYNVPIRHFGEGLQPKIMEYGRYGVVRNNVYKLTLNSIKTYGDINIPKKDYPDDKESFLSVQFQILPWIVRAQDIDL